MSSVVRLLAVALTAAALLTPPAPAHATLPPESTWRADVANVMEGSRAWADRRIDHGGHKLAINLDIDNSALATHYEPGAAIPQVLRFARHAHRRGVALLFNTARYGRMLRVARHQLHAAGYPVTELCGRATRTVQAADNKRRCRQHFVREGYTLIANVGNRRTDFLGGNYERAFRLPNYHNQLA